MSRTTRPPSSSTIRLTTAGLPAAPMRRPLTGLSLRRPTPSPPSGFRAGRWRKCRWSIRSPSRPTGRGMANRISTTPLPRPVRGWKTSRPTLVSTTFAPPLPRPPTGLPPSARSSSRSGATPTASSATTSTCASRATMAKSRSPTSRSSSASAKAVCAASSTAAPAAPARIWCSSTASPNPRCPTKSTPGTSTANRSSGCGSTSSPTMRRSACTGLCAKARCRPATLPRTCGPTTSVSGTLTKAMFRLRLTLPATATMRVHSPPILARPPMSWAPPAAAALAGRVWSVSLKTKAAAVLSFPIPPILSSTATRRFPAGSS